MGGNLVAVAEGDIFVSAKNSWAAAESVSRCEPDGQ